MSSYAVLDDARRALDAAEACQGVSLTRDERLAFGEAARTLRFGIYSSTKFALEGLSEVLHAELAPLGIHVTAVEPGYFRTDILDASSLSVSLSRIADYDRTAGAVRSVAAGLSHRQSDNRSKLAEVLVAFAEEPDPPVRLPLGGDTVAAIEAKHEADRAILSKWRKVALSTDFAAD